MIIMFLSSHKTENDLDDKVDNLHSTDDGEASEETHGASNC